MQQLTCNMVWSFLFILFLHTALELPKILLVYKHHRKEFLLQASIVCGFFLHYGTQDAFLYNEGVTMSIFMVALLLNLLESLSSNMFCGKHILLAAGVFKTLLKTALPVTLLILMLAANGLALRQKHIISSTLDVLGKY